MAAICGDGSVLRLPALGMSVMAAAVRLGKFCGNGPRLWLQMQLNHDLWEAERRLAPEVARIRTPRAA